VLWAGGVFLRRIRRTGCYNGYMAMPAETRIVYCRCGYSEEVPSATKDAALSVLAGSDAPFEAVPDLCELAALHDPLLAAWAREDSLRIVACHPRAVTWLFHAGGADLADADGKVLNMKDLSAEEITRRLTAALTSPAGRPAGASAGEAAPGVLEVVLYEGPGARPLDPARRVELLTALLDGRYRLTRSGPDGWFRANASAVVVVGEFENHRPCEIPGLEGRRAAFRDIAGKRARGTLQAVQDAREELQLPEPGTWVPWFPVLDYDRCVGCRQCADFCIFGVFEVSDEGQVRVVRPANCKTNCPACARMCRQVAIIFPKFPSGPINGAEVDEEKVRAERAGSDLGKLLRGDVYNVLRQRGVSAKELAAGPGADASARILKSLDAAERAHDDEEERDCCE